MGSACLTMLVHNVISLGTARSASNGLIILFFTSIFLVQSRTSLSYLKVLGGCYGGLTSTDQPRYQSTSALHVLDSARDGVSQTIWSFQDMQVVMRPHSYSFKAESTSKSVSACLELGQWLDCELSNDVISTSSCF